MLLVLGIRLVGVAVLWVAATADGRSAHARLVRWDSQWYAGIAAHGYGFVRVQPDGRHLADYAFFPLYPLLERGLHAAVGLRYVDAGLLVSAVATAAAAWGIYAVGERVSGDRAALLLVGLWAAVPVAIVSSMAYSEALFTALAAWSTYALLTRRWLVAGLLAALAGLTRPVGVAVVAAVLAALVVELLARRWSPACLAAAVLAPLGWLGYVGWVGWRTGEPLGYFRVAAGWRNGFDGGRAFAGWIGEHLTGTDWPQGVLLVLAVLVLLLLLVLAVRDRQPVPLLVYAGVLVLLTLTTSGYFGSKPRYLLPAFPLLLPVAVRLARRRWRWVAVGALAAGSVAYGAVWLLGPGPP